MISLEELKKKYEELLQQLSNPGVLSDGGLFEKLLREKEKYEKLIEKNNELLSILQKIEETRTFANTERDPSLILLAEMELKTYQKREQELNREIADILGNHADEHSRDLSKNEMLPTKKESPNGVIVEIRAGVGGEEAALFAADLFRMYSRYAQRQGWKQKVLDSSPTELGGFKQIVFELESSGQDVLEKLQWEAGVHRIQRIPKTEKSGRIHTSTCSVAILPKPQKKQIKIRPDDLKIETYRASGPGGQYVNRRETAVRIIHIPTGIVVTSQTERSQPQNKENAMAILEAKLLEREQKEEIAKMAGKRKTQIGTAKRAEKIRTYNFPQDRITDHRVQKSWYNIEEIMAGKLDPIIKTLHSKSLNLKS